MGVRQDLQNGPKRSKRQERALRDALAEAMWLASFGVGKWSNEHPALREVDRVRADRLLARLPALGLTLLPVSSTEWERK